jgi:cytochrome c
MNAHAAALGAALSLAAALCQAAPDATRGEQVYARCLACHALASDRVGPRPAACWGGEPAPCGFAYSPAMKNSR